MRIFPGGGAKLTYPPASRPPDSTTAADAVVAGAGREQARGRAAAGAVPGGADPPRVEVVGERAGQQGGDDGDVGAEPGNLSGVPRSP